jgi:hypothetical protein
MRFRTMVDDMAEAATLADKKRLGKNQKARLATLTTQLSQATQPPPTPRRAPTGQRGDFQGNVYQMHRIDRFGAHGHLRDMRRSNKTGRGAIQFQRSRIQRARRKQRTGGVR